MVCDELVDPNKNLFICSPLDERRISPNPSSAANENHLQYFRFAGRIIGLCLKHSIQTGLLFDPIFFKTLSETAVCWQDLRESDYVAYMSYKRLLEIDAEEFDKSNGYGLVFAVDVTENSGALRSHALIVNGEDVVVTSDNRESYVKLKFQHNCVTLVREQTLSFSEGVDEMLSDGIKSSIFFSSIQLEDLDFMLRGSEQDYICLDQWRAHTSYKGFNEDDDVIKWFWQTVDEMNNDQRRNLLHFWTAVNYLPRGGFSGLPQILTIRQTTKATNLLPKSSTCFYQLTPPIYPTFATTKLKVLYVVDEEVCYSFGGT